MKVRYADLVKEDREYEFYLEELKLEDKELLGLRDTDTLISFSYGLDERLKMRIQSEGIMLCPCAITAEEVEVPFELDEEVLIIRDDKEYKGDEDCYLLQEDSEVEEILLHFVRPLIPFKVVKNSEIEYPRGDGWKVISEADYQQSHSNQHDSRWDKLREFEFDEEEGEV